MKYADYKRTVMRNLKQAEKNGVAEIIIAIAWHWICVADHYHHISVDMATEKLRRKVALKKKMEKLSCVFDLLRLANSPGLLGNWDEKINEFCDSCDGNNFDNTKYPECPRCGGTIVGYFSIDKDVIFECEKCNNGTTEWALLQQWASQHKES